METQLSKQVKPSALAVMAHRFNVEPQKLLDTLKDTVFKGASSSELMALVVVANEYGLNPLTKEIYAFPAKGGGIVPVVSVDGWTRILNSHPQMDGLDFEFQNDVKGDLESCTCIIYRKDRNRPVRVTEYLSECRRNTEPWKMQHRMLRHKALIQCARVAFGFSGIFDEDEAIRVAHVENIVVDAGEALPPTRPTEKPKKPSFKKAVEAVEAVEVIEEPVEELVEEPKEEPAEDFKEEGFALDPTPEEINWHRRLMVLLSNEGIMEQSFVGYINKRMGKKYDMVTSFPENLARNCVQDFNIIREEVK
jgi:phage recombination protein Bet